MPCKTGEKRPFSGFFLDFKVILAFEGFLLSITLKGSWDKRIADFDRKSWPGDGALSARRVSGYEALALLLEGGSYESFPESRLGCTQWGSYSANQLVTDVLRFHNLRMRLFP